MGLFQKIAGIIGDTFLLGCGATAHAIKDDADGVKVVANDGVTAANLVAARPQGANADTHVSSYLDLKERVLDVISGFAGSSPPGSPTNGQYYLCHTTGGSYVAGAIYRAAGGVVPTTPIPIYQGMQVAVRDTFSGTVSMYSNNLYVAQSGSAPYSWTLKSIATSGLVTLGRRIEPDASDLAVFTFDNGSDIGHNSGSLGAANDLVVVSGNFDPHYGVFGNSAYSPGGDETLAAIPYENLEPADLSIDFWFKIAALCNDGNYFDLLVKPYTTADSWSDPYATIAIRLRSLGFDLPWLFLGQTTTGGVWGETPMSYEQITPGQWHHFGFTWKSGASGTSAHYLDGREQISSSHALTLDYGTTHPDWELFANHSTATPERLSNAWIDDLRISGIVRPASYFANIYQSGHLGNF